MVATSVLRMLRTTLRMTHLLMRVSHCVRVMRALSGFVLSTVSSVHNWDKQTRCKRHNLFQILFVIHDRRARVIIDGGSCNNLVSADLVQKFGLPTRPHKHPYHVQWLNDSGKVKVNQTARVHFSLGPYSDYADCDVVPMDTCSLLLGRPWEFDNDAVHHDRSNTYTLMYKGQKITLHPMTPAEIVQADKE
jgi:hypothetical protein